MRALKLFVFLSMLVPLSAFAQQTGGSCLVTGAGDWQGPGVPGVCAPVERWGPYRYGFWSSYYPMSNPPYGWATEQEAMNAFSQTWPDTCGWGPPQRVIEYWWYTHALYGSQTSGPLHFDDLDGQSQTIEFKLIDYNWYADIGPCNPHWPLTPALSLWKSRAAGCPKGFKMGNWLPSDEQPGEWVWSYVLQEPFVCGYVPPFDLKNLGCCSSPGLMGGNPIHLGTGNKYQAETDFVDPRGGLLTLTRAYNSLGLEITTLGKGWRHSFERSIYVSTGTALSRRLDGKSYKFLRQSDGTWKSDVDIVERLQQQVDGGGATLGWTLLTKSDDTEIYDANGRLTKIAYLNGQLLTFAYSDASTPPAVAPGPNFLLRVQDALGRAVALTYDSSGRLVQFTDTGGASYVYAYDAANNRLTSVTYPDGGVREYVYNEPAYASTDLAYALTGIIDENGDRFATFTYDNQGRAIASEHAGGVGRISLTFWPPTFVNNIANFVTSISDSLGTTQDLSLTNTLYTYKVTRATQPCPSCSGGLTKAITYDANGNVSVRTDFNSVSTLYQYDLTRNLETSRTEANGLPQQRVITTQWHPIFRLPTQITEPAPGGTKTTTLTYDGSGNLTQRSITAPKNDGTSGTITRTWSWTFQTLGRIATATDPDGHVTTYTYYPDTDSDLRRRGSVATITNAVGHVTQMASYDLTGRPLTIIDANGLTTTLTYDPRGRLTTRQVGTETTRYAYDAAGQLVKVTLPDGSFLAYTYDAAHRLTGIDDGLGNAIDYTLDAMGNRVQEKVFDPSDNLARTRSRTIDALNRLASDLGAVGQTTAYTYDVNGNLTTVTDPLNHVTVNSYDALYRLISVLDPNLNTISYAYDAAGNLTQVTDQRSQATSYTYDGLNNLTKQVSPDTGTTTNTYDPAGNLLTKTDARGVTATYTYDNVNRTTQIAYSKSGAPNETHVFAYDSGTNAKGKLTQVVDPAATTSWTYNSQGRIASKSQLIGNVSQTVSYGYNSAGLLSTTTTPSGQQIAYSYANNRVSGISINGQTLLSGATTEPFGPVALWFWGNGLKMWRDFDTDGRLIAWEFRNGTAVLRKDQSFDLASRIVGISDPVNPLASQTYEYDPLDRLIVAQTGSPVTHTQQFVYDEVGNRQNATVDGNAVDLFYGAANNRLQSMSGAVSASYLNGATALTFTYNNANRLAMIQSSGNTLATYSINALGQRVSKTIAGVTTRFIYDEQGHLVGEYDGSGNLIQETVWLEDLPVATLRPTGALGNPTPIAIYYVHADHLGSPRAVTRPSDNALMWQWDNLDPFGANTANENPSAQGIFKYGLRFPGQYFDTETTSHYHYFRDYDPSIGRYEQSDPIWLRGGLNLYIYVDAHPPSSIDLYGMKPRGGTGFSQYYGNWCGRNWSGGQGGPIIPGNPAGPIDSVDRCCMNHDYCYAELQCTGCIAEAQKNQMEKDCDLELISCLEKLRAKSPTNWPEPPPPGTESNAYYFCQKAKWAFKYKWGVPQ